MNGKKIDIFPIIVPLPPLLPPLETFGTVLISDQNLPLEWVSLLV